MCVVGGEGSQCFSVCGHSSSSLHSFSVSAALFTRQHSFTLYICAGSSCRPTEPPRDTTHRRQSNHERSLRYALQTTLQQFINLMFRLRVLPLLLYYTSVHRHHSNTLATTRNILGTAQQHPGNPSEH